MITINEIKLIYNQKDQKHYLYDGESFIDTADEPFEACMKYFNLIQLKQQEVSPKEIAEHFGWEPIDKEGE